MYIHVPTYSHSTGIIFSVLLKICICIYVGAWNQSSSDNTNTTSDRQSTYNHTPSSSRRSDSDGDCANVNCVVNFKVEEARRICCEFILAVINFNILMTEEC